MMGNNNNSKTTPSSNVADTKKGMGRITISLIIIAVLLIIFSFFAPYLFTHLSIIELPNNNIIGDTIGGIMNPFLALAGVLITFLAFYMQYRANELQRDLFFKQMREQQTQFNRTQFESQFYEMLRLHKENVNEMSILGYEKEIVQSIEGGPFGNRLGDSKKTTTSQVKDYKIEGRKIFVVMKNELEILFELYKQHYKNFSATALETCYKVFFMGIDHHVKNTSAGKANSDFFKELKQISNTHKESNGQNRVFKNVKIYIKYKPFSGHQSRLAHYYRHLFQMVKFVVNQDENFISYEEKRNYLRILRAQLSNQEQALLFYNWYSGFGGQWESDENKFLTDYRMIHNLYQDLIIEDFNLEQIFKLENNSYKKEKNRDVDSLFEYQDW